MSPSRQDGTTTVAGLDPGPKPGSILLTITDRTATATTGLELAELLEADYLAVERYVIQPRSGRSQDKGAQTATLVMAEEAYTQGLARIGRANLQYLGPGNVKPWATDRRLERYGLLVKGGHHRDAARHALYLAVRRGLLPKL